jgi:site-specific recombinase XerD
MSLTVASSTGALASMIEDTLNYANASRASGTTKQYESNWRGFLAFCTQQGLSPLPATSQIVAVYLSALAKAGKATSTVASHLAAIKYFHDRARVLVNWQDPILSEVLAGIRRSSERRVQKAEAILPADLRALVATTDNTLGGLRDRAILLVGFAGAFRRSEITAITVENVERVEEGMVVRLDRSKTDQEGRGAEIAIPFAADQLLCPVRSLIAWLSSADISSGPAFRRVLKTGSVGTEALSEEAIRLILAKAVERAGLEGKFSPHSLRAGFCTSAALAGASLEAVARQARHTSIQTTLGYVRVAGRFKNHAGAGLL